MTVDSNLAQMATATAPHTTKGMPQRGSYITVDGVELYVTSSAQVAGAIVVTGLDSANQVHTVHVPA